MKKEDTMSELYMRGTKTPKHSRQTKNHGKGRVCTTNGCEQVLSIYNHNKQCFLHAPAKTPRIRGRLHPDDKK